MGACDGEQEHEEIARSARPNHADELDAESVTESSDLPQRLKEPLSLRLHLRSC
jgi:hypothetical protein